MAEYDELIARLEADTRSLSEKILANQRTLNADPAAARKVQDLASHAKQRFDDKGWALVNVAEELFPRFMRLPVMQSVGRKYDYYHPGYGESPGASLSLEPTDDHEGRCKLELSCSYQEEFRMAEAVIRLTGDVDGKRYEHQIAGTQINLDNPDASKEVQWAKKNLVQAAKRYLEIRAKNPRTS